MEKGIKCPNCGYVSTKHEEYCPNCDRFEPTFEDFTKDLSELKKLDKTNEKAASTQATDTEEKLTVETNEQVTAEIDAGAEKETLEVPKSTREPEVVIDKFSAAEKPVIAKEPEVGQAAVNKEQEAETQVTNKKPSNKNSKLIGVIVLLIALVVGGYVGITKYQDKKEAERVVTEEKKIALLENNLNKLYFNEEKIFLSESFAGEELTKLEKELATLDKDATKDYKKEISPVIEDLNKRGEQQEAVNGLFTTPIIKGDQLVAKAVLKEGNLTLPEISGKPADDFEKLINKGIDEATTQEKNNKKAKELMAKVFDKEPKKDVSRKAHDDAKESVSKLKNPTTKKEYEEQLTKVDQVLKSQEKAQKEKDAQAEEQRQQEAAAAVQAEAEANATQQNPTDSGRQGITLPNENNGTMAGDWSWAPGIQEKVIGTCLERGYIVEGGYELRQHSIIDGEAYYDLYATSTQSSLLQERSAEELPIYLVTINAKTGWFKGQGPN